MHREVSNFGVHFVLAIFLFNATSNLTATAPAGAKCFALSFCVRWVQVNQPAKQVEGKLNTI